ncbi:TylF/MycF/NovP-related O-methyltransferase [Succinivibrio dextrinosolvens]|uniref:TylF/MycF/NovP-related O-methyltransferase n=1 Tax=Succinivibrio dextrinosolvens TaxID=83771 RepID=UPI00068C8971|nr:TylF/MycF/NovP-related O-methyltransferase [Succinivibrio dextrinosolvens]
MNNEPESDQQAILYGCGSYIEKNMDLIPYNLNIIGYGYTDPSRATSLSGNLFKTKNIYNPKEIAELINKNKSILIYICSGPISSLEIFLILRNEGINVKNIRFVDESRFVGFPIKKIINEQGDLNIYIEGESFVQIKFNENIPSINWEILNKTPIKDINNLCRYYQIYISSIKKIKCKLNVIPWFIGAFPQSLLNKEYIMNDVFNLLPKYIGEVTLNNMQDMHRLYSLILNIRHVMDSAVPGEFAELGVYKGCTAAVLKYYATLNNRKLYLFDTFEGFLDEDLVSYDKNQAKQFNDTSENFVKEYIEADDNVFFVKGYFPESLQKEHCNLKFAFVNLDCDLHKPMLAGLEFFYPRLSNGGMIFLHDYSSGYWEGCKQAIDIFCKKNGCQIVLLPDLSGSAVLVKHY